MVCYANSLSGPFVLDDRYAIAENASIRSLAGVLNLRRETPVAGRPLVALSFALNHRVGGLEVRGYHLANIAIHICTSLLVFGIARRTLRTPRLRSRYGAENTALAFAIALIWTVHPLNTETVDYVTQRTESLMAFMLMLTLYASIRGLEDTRSTRWPVTALVACALGMACKETMVVAPLLVVLYDRIFAFQSVREAAHRRSRLYVGLFLGWLVLAYLNVEGPRSGSAGLSSAADSWNYLLNQTVMIVRYLRLAVWPADLVINYGPPAPLTLTQVLPHAIAVGALLILTLLSLVRWPAVGFLAAWFMITLAPTSSFVPIATEVGAERRMYLPLMVLVAGSVLAVYHFSNSNRLARPLRIATLIVALLTLSATTMARNREYTSALTLAQTTLERWPSPAAHGMVGTELAILGRDDEALPELRVGAPSDPRARYNLGITLFNLKDYEGAIRELELLAREHPMRAEVPLARRVAGNAYAGQQKWEEAIEQYRLVLSMLPFDEATKRLLVDALVKHGTAFGSSGRPVDAIPVLRRALELDPSNPIASHNLATAMLDTGDAAGAVAQARRTMTANGADAASHDLIGRALALQGRYDEAVQELEQALRLSPNDAQIQDDLKQVRAARADSKRSGKAVK